MVPMWLRVLLACILAVTCLPALILYHLRALARIDERFRRQNADLDRWFAQHHVELRQHLRSQRVVCPKCGDRGAVFRGPAA